MLQDTMARPFLSVAGLARVQASATVFTENGLAVGELLLSYSEPTLKGAFVGNARQNPTSVYCTYTLLQSSVIYEHFEYVLSGKQ